MKTMGEQLAALKDKIVLVAPQPVNKVVPPETKTQFTPTGRIKNTQPQAQPIPHSLRGATRSYTAID